MIITSIILAKMQVKNVINALSRLATFMNVSKKRIIVRPFIESQFIGHCPLVWMLHSRNLNNKINCIHEWAWNISYNNKSSSFQDLLDIDTTVTIHHGNIRTLASETCKVQLGISPPLLNKVFVERGCNYNLRRNSFLNRRRVNSARHGTESVSYLSPKIWDILPNNQKMGSNGNILADFVKHMYRIYLVLNLKICKSLNKWTSTSFSLHFVCQCIKWCIIRSKLILLVVLLSTKKEVKVKRTPLANPCQLF